MLQVQAGWAEVPMGVGLGRAVGLLFAAFGKGSVEVGGWGFGFAGGKESILGLR